MSSQFRIGCGAAALGLVGATLAYLWWTSGSKSPKGSEKPSVPSPQSFSNGPRTVDSARISSSGGGVVGASPAISQAIVRTGAFQSGSGTVSDPVAEAAATKRQQESQLAADAVQFFQRPLAEINARDYEGFLATSSGRYTNLTSADVKRVVLAQFLSKADEARALVERLSSPVEIESAVRTEKDRLSTNIRECVERVQRLRGYHGDDGEMNAAWVSQVEARKKQNVALAQICKQLSGQSPDLSGSETAKMMSINPHSPHSSRELDAILEPYKAMSGVSGMSVSAILEKARATDGYQALVSEYDAHEREKEEAGRRQGALREEYNAQGGMYFNPDCDRDASGYRVADGSRIDALQKDLAAAQVRISERYAGQAAFWNGLLMQLV